MIRKWVGRKGSFQFMVMACRAGHRFQDFMAIELSERNEIYFPSLTMAAVF
jgi:hypothetical protein